jgi:hypothetical protein
MLSAWESFYVIVGSSAGALIGLQFVVITLIAGRRHHTSVGALSAFGTPTVVHLAGALLVSAIMSAPWKSFGELAIALAMCGLGGLVYGAVVLARARRQTEYAPVWQDWLWYTAMPFVAYTALAATAAWLRGAPQEALFGVGASTLGLLLIGIHNAWDTVTHLVVPSSDEETQA